MGRKSYFAALNTWRDFRFSRVVRRSLLRARDYLSRKFRPEIISLDSVIDVRQFGLEGNIQSRTPDSLDETVQIRSATKVRGVLTRLFEPREIWFLRNAVHDFSYGASYINGKGISESSFWAPEKSIVRPALALHFAKKNNPTVPVVVASPKNWNYYHWMVEELPSLIRASSHFPNLLVATSPGLPLFASTCLRSVGLRFTIRNGLHKFENMVLVGKSHETGWPRPHDLSLVRSALARLVDNSIAANPVKIFISRRHASRNSNFSRALEKELTSSGFLVLHAEDLSLSDQIKAFRAASVVVAFHGAGLTNIMFCNPGAKVIEIFEDRRHIPCYELIANYCGLSYEAFAIAPSDDASNCIRQIKLLAG